MMRGSTIYDQCLASLLVLLSVSGTCESYPWDNWLSSSVPKTIPMVEFSMDGMNDEKGVRLVQNAQNKLIGSNSCWENAYGHLLAGCKDIFASDEKRSRFAWHLSDCFQKDSGRPPFPFCDGNSAMLVCLKKLNDLEHRVYLEFLLETNSICYQLQNQAFKHDTERLVNELRNSASYAEEKLDSIQDRTEFLLQNSNQIHDSLSVIDVQIRNVDHKTQNLQGHMDSLIEYSQTVYKQAVEIADSQMELQKGQTIMNDQLKEGMTMLDDAYKSLGVEVGNLKNEAVLIENQISNVGDAIASSMGNLQRKADHIGNMAGVSLDKQQQLIQGQSTALEGLQFLTRSQSEALEESRNTMHQLAEYGRKQQEELLKRQEQLQKVHDHLVENSKSILAAQEAFESKQASMFLALDKLFSLHNAMLLESRIIKAFFIYFTSIFIIYMFTSTKQTYTVRPRLYIGLCGTFLIEVAILRFTSEDIEQKTWMVNLIRSLFVAIASFQLLYAICTYRDYEFLNHQMLVTLIEKVNKIESGNKELSWETDTDSDVDWCSWIDSELTEDVDKVDDPDYIEDDPYRIIPFPGENRRYDLRYRR